MIKTNGQSGEEDNSIELDVTPLNLNGKLTHRVFVHAGGKVVHVDTIDVGRANDRTKFLDALEEEAAEQGLTVDRRQYKQALLRYAGESSSGLETTEVSAPESDPDPDVLLRAFGIEVLGEGEDQSVHIWCERTKKRSRIQNLGRWNIQEMRQLLGQKADELLWDGSKSSPSDDAYVPTDLQRAVALKAAELPRISTSTLMVSPGIVQ